MREDAAGPAPPPLVGLSQAFSAAVRELELYAAGDDPVVFTGPSGVGKGLFARHLHHQTRPGKPLVHLPGGALVESLYQDQLFGHLKGAFTGADADVPGAFERAAGGTLFLDELGHWSRAAQQAVLDVLERRVFTPLGARREVRVTARIVVGSKEPLETLLRRDRLIEDLLYRLGDLGVAIPPLARRPADTMPLAYHYLDRRRGAAGGPGPVLFEPAAVGRLIAYDWPGNAREVGNAVAFAWIHAAADGADGVGVAHLPGPLRALRRAAPDLPRADKEALARWAFERLGRRRAAARVLAWHPNTLAKHVRRVVGEARGG